MRSWTGIKPCSTPVQFPIHVIDKNMNWVFLNKAFEKLMVDNKIIRSRKDRTRYALLIGGCEICKTENAD